MKDFDTLDISLVVSDIALQDKPSEEAVRKEIIRHIADVAYFGMIWPAISA
mgnify:CR=1 FL=1